MARLEVEAEAVDLRVVLEGLWGERMGLDLDLDFVKFRSLM